MEKQADGTPKLQLSNTTDMTYCASLYVGRVFYLSQVRGGTVQIGKDLRAT